jgi:pimeloyl-ACP methyl ester carboxylesterase
VTLDLTPLPERTDVRSGAATLAVEHGGGGPAVVCLHAGVADRRSWRPMAPWLDGEARLVAWDRRGFGDTTLAGPEPFDHVADLLAVLDVLGLEQVVLVGNSQGGRVAIDTALEHPDRVAGLVLVAAAYTGAPASDEPWPDWLVEVDRRGDAAEEAFERRGDLDGLNAVEALLWLDGPRGPEGRIDGPARELFLSMNGRALAAADPGGTPDREPAWDRLDRIAVPVAVAEGTLDLPWSPDRGRAAADRIPRATFHLFDGVAHLPTLERPELVADLVRDVLTRG